MVLNIINIKILTETTVFLTLTVKLLHHVVYYPIGNFFLNFLFPTALIIIKFLTNFRLFVLSVSIVKSAVQTGSKWV